MKRLLAVYVGTIFIVLLIANGAQYQIAQHILQFARVCPDINDGEKSSATTVAGVHIPFTANYGQTDEQVKFYARTFGGTVFVTKTGEIVYSLPTNDHTAGQFAHKGLRSFCSDEYIGLALTERFVGGSIGDVHGEGRAITKINSFKGNDPAQWRRDVPSYESVDLGEVFDGINLRLRAYGNNVEKLFCLSPGADVGDIRVQLSGAAGLRVNNAGKLEVETDCGVVAFTKPVAYQEKHGGKEFIEAGYTINGEEYGFAVGDYDRDRPLIIDPLLASTFIGGTDRDGLFETPLIRDEYGNVYVASRTNSTDFPVTTGAYNEEFNGGLRDIFIAKLSGDLTVLIAATFLGGSGSDAEWPGVAMTMDESGNLFVTAQTRSTDFPTTTGAYRENHTTSDAEVFVAKLSGDLSSLLAATYLGGSQNEYFITIAADHNGHVYLAGSTGSGDFPVTSGVVGGTYRGGGGPYPADVFVAKFDDNLTTLIAATYLGGTNNDYPEDIEIDASGNIYFAGWTSSGNYPTVEGSYDRFFGGGSYDAFVSKLNDDFTVLVASTFLGGNQWDFGYGLTLDADKNVYVTGHTASSHPTIGFPTTPGAYDRTYGHGEVGIEGENDDAFISKFDSNLTILQSSTFLGGTGWENGSAMIVDSDGNILVAGHTRSSDFPWTAGAHDTLYNGAEDGFISRLNGDLQSLTASTYLGGSVNESIGSIALDDTNMVYVAGITSSADYPTTALAYNDWAYDESYNGGGDPTWGGDRGGDVFITRIDLDWAVKDADGDGYPNGSDNCPYVFNIPNDDADLDGFGDACDNCPETYNPEQEDLNQNWIGDSCEVRETWYVQADGLGDAPTIQAAIDSTIHGDTVMVADGIYTGEGNWELDFHGRHILLRSENGPQFTIIDCAGSAEEPRRAFTFASDEDSTFIVDGFTIRNGYGLDFSFTSSGGAMFFDNASPTVKNCVFTGNTAALGGALFANHAEPRLINCTFADNSATQGAAMFLYASSSIAPENCLIAFNQTGQPVVCLISSQATLSCCDVYGNAAGDWVGSIAGQNGVNGNFSADPLFCNVGIGDVGLDDESSPCLPDNNDCSVLIGALGVGCSCNCGVAGDVDCNEATDPLDVTYLVNYVYLSLDALCEQPSCPYPVGDLDCNGDVDPLDVAYIVNAVYKSQNAICDGCAP